MENNQSPRRTERVALLKSIQNLSEEWRQLSPEDKETDKEKALELYLEETQQRHQSCEEAKENIRREELRERAYMSASSLRI